MHRGLSRKTKQFLSSLIKVGILFGASYFVYDRLANNDSLDLRQFLAALKNNQLFTEKNILILLGLTVLNWLLETLKWKTLVSTVKKISFRESLEQSLGAMTASLMTPNRMGEYGAKALYFFARNRPKVLFLNLWGNMMQMLVTLTTGGIGLWVLVNKFQVDIIGYRVLRIAILAVLVLSLGILGGSQRKFNIKGYTFARIKGFVKRMPPRIHIASLLLSLFRYAVFSYQFFFMLKSFGTELGYVEAMIGISSMYLLASIVPTLTLFDVVIKSTAAVWVFGHFGIDELSILCIATMMWLLNFVLPSIFGGYYVLNFRLDPPHPPDRYRDPLPKERETSL